ncbi:anti-anti-sigma factor [Mycolicibacterium iranicum]|uniref:Anti-sigma factor antagonist n=1 Tax=Mycolicibacterium iranicum TaxID=912594 RepID=A0A839Q973_MYCIR|nr:STAS domain-containing protein [Mycolicibacterium iranicum]MBB2989151.1 anti-anti-sigma factor [Mycolicibacterium iranicum]
MTRSTDTRVNGLRVESSTRDRVTVISADGPVDLATCPVLVEAINAALATDPAALVLELSKVDILGSAGLEVLVRTRHAADPQMYLALVADGPATSRVIEITGLNLVMPLHKSLDDAMAAWRARQDETGGQRG